MNSVRGIIWAISAVIKQLCAVRHFVEYLLPSGELFKLVEVDNFLFKQRGTHAFLPHIHGCACMPFASRDVLLPISILVS